MGCVHVGLHLALASQNELTACGSPSDHGFPNPSGKYPFVPPTAKLRIRKNSLSKGALLSPLSQGLSHGGEDHPPSSQKDLEMVKFSTVLSGLSRCSHVGFVPDQAVRVEIGGEVHSLFHRVRLYPRILVHSLFHRVRLYPRILVPRGSPMQRGSERVVPARYGAYEGGLPRDSIMSLAGHLPYWLRRGSSQYAGHSQSPRGSLARISTRP